MSDKWLDPQFCGYRVLATAIDPRKPAEPPRLRPISRNFSARAAAEDFCELARKDYPDAYIAAVPVKERKHEKGRYA